MPNKADVKTTPGRTGKKARIRAGLPAPWQASYTKKEENWAEEEKERILGALAAAEQQAAESVAFHETDAPTPAESNETEKREAA